MNNKEIIKYFYEYVVSKNLIDEAAHLHDVRNLDVCVCFYTPTKLEFAVLFHKVVKFSFSPFKDTLI